MLEQRRMTLSVTPSLSPLVTLNPPILRNSSKTLNSYKACSNLTELQQFHCNQIKLGLDHRLSPVTNLILSCVEIGELDSLNHARNAFDYFKIDKMSPGTVFMHNCLIRGYGLLEFGNEAIGLYVHMVSEGLVADKFTLSFVLNACAKIGACSVGCQIHGMVWKMGLEKDLYIGNSLIHFYAECGEISVAHKVFDEMSMRNVVSWTSLISGYTRLDLPNEAVELFFKMVDAGEKPNSMTMVSVVSSCAKLKDLQMGKWICDYIGKMGMKLNSFMVNAIVEMYMKCEAFDEAKRIFNESVDRDLVLYNTLLSNYSDQGMSNDVFCVFNDLLNRGLKPDKVTILSILSVAAHTSDLSLGRCCHGFAIRNSLQKWDSIVSSIIDMYMKSGELKLASRVFNLMEIKTTASWNIMLSGHVRNGDADSVHRVFNMLPVRDLVSWNTMIGFLVQENLFQEAVELFKAMQIEDVKPDRVTLMSIALAAGHIGASNLAKWIHSYITKAQIHRDMKLNTSLIDMFSRCGDHQNAMRIFHQIPKPDVSAWTSAISCAAMVGDGDQAIELFHKMLQQKTSPDEILFVQLLTSCSHSGLVKQGVQIFKSMEEIYNVSPRVEHYGCMVDLYGRAGMFENALSLIKSMSIERSIEPNEVVWSSLLAACRIHNNVELAMYVDQQMSDMKKHRVGTKVLMSNIYASVGKWTEVAELRMELREKGGEKSYGLSWIEIDGEVYEFMCGGDEFYEI